VTRTVEVSMEDSSRQIRPQVEHWKGTWSCGSSEEFDGDLRRTAQDWRCCSEDSKFVNWSSHLASSKLFAAPTGTKKTRQKVNKNFMAIHSQSTAKATLKAIKNYTYKNNGNCHSW
jgi:hypothetical protein